MPTSPNRICPRCRKPAPAGARCPCNPAWSGSAWKNGSTRQWRKVRARQLREHPLCQWPGCIELAKHVDHKKNLASAVGAAERERLKYERSNLQSLCEPHHDQKTNRESHQAR